MAKAYSKVSSREEGIAMQKKEVCISTNGDFSAVKGKTTPATTNRVGVWPQTRPPPHGERYAGLRVESGSPKPEKEGP